MRDEESGSPTGTVETDGLDGGSAVDIPVETMTGRPVARALRSKGRSVREALASL